MFGMEITFGVLLLKQPAGRDEHLRTGILQHVLQTLRRIFVIQRDISPACLEYCKSAHEEFLAARQHDRSEGIRLHTPRDKAGRQGIRCPVQLFIGHRADFIYKRCRCRMQTHLLLE